MPAAELEITGEAENKALLKIHKMLLGQYDILDLGNICTVTDNSLDAGMLYHLRNRGFLELIENSDAGKAQLTLTGMGITLTAQLAATPPPLLEKSSLPPAPDWDDE